MAYDEDAGFDLNELLHPAQAFERPSDIVRDPDLSLNEKRAILASWASDVCSVEGMPTLRAGSNGKFVSFDEIMDALRQLDKDTSEVTDRARKRERRQAIFGLAKRGRGQGDSGAGQPLY